jgi:hypothetical protein
MTSRAASKRSRRHHDELRASLRPLLELSVERVLVSHGEPVLRNGKRALADLLAT